jgi:hypothetical protein
LSDPKRGGSRDISELKQRLGLKKGGAAATGGTPARNGTPGVVPPPGLAVAPPAPPQPVIPNAAEDPFGAMNAMASVGTVQRAPEIVIVNDGKPVENVSASSRGAVLAKVVAPAVLTLVVGIGIGKISKGADVYNEGLKDSRQILGVASVGAVRYGALIQAPTATDRVDFGVKLVELGPPYCGAAPSPSSSGKCENDEPPSAYAYRSDPGAVWTKGDLQATGSDAVPTKKLVLLVASGTRDMLIKGGDPGASEVFYVKRLKALAERTKKLIDEGNKLEQRLQLEANKGDRFSFFM